MSARNPQQNAELNISYKAPDTEKEKCQSSYACRMDAVREQLQKLNSEMADLTGKVETARDNWLKAPDARQEAKLEKVCEDLKKKEELLDTRIAKLEDNLPSSGAGPTAAAAVPAKPWLQNFWYQLAAVEQPSKVNSAQILQLGNNACFPQEGHAVQGRLLVRRCYIDLAQQSEYHFSCSGHTFIVTGSPGIGKSLFLYFFMWQLARSGETVIWDRRDRIPIMFSSQGVMKGPLEAFESQMDDPETWYLVDGKPPVYRRAKTVLVTSLDWNVWKEAIKRPDSIVRYMPVWSWEEIQAARQHIFISQPKEDVDSRYSEWGGIPRYVFQKTDMADQALLEDALDSCSLNDLAGSITNPSTASSISHRLLHLTVKAGYLKGPVVFASDWVEGEVISRYSQYKQREVQDFLAATAHQPGVAAFRGALWEHYAHMALQRGGCFSCRNLQDPEAVPFQIKGQPCSSCIGLWDVEDISTELRSGVYGWGRNKNLPSVDAIVQPDKLFQMAVSGHHKIDERGLSAAVHAMQAKEREVQLFFVVPPDVVASYPRQTLKRIREDFAAASVAHAIKQYVLTLP